MKELLKKIKEDTDYKEWVDWGQARPGHPEGSQRAHIEELEENLEKIKGKVNEEEYWKLMLLIHTHDTFKGKAKRIERSDGSTMAVPIEDPESHASLAMIFLNKYHDDPDLSNMLQYHDEPYAIYRKYKRLMRKGKEWAEKDQKRLKQLLNTIKDWDLFLKFNLIDNVTKGKMEKEPEMKSMVWWLDEVNKHKKTEVTKEWIKLLL